MSLLRRFLNELFPFPRSDSAEAYSSEQIRGAQANIDKLRAVADREKLEQLRDHAVARKTDEDQRQTSIITRAQGLLVGLALFGVLLTFAANFLTSGPPLGSRWLIPYAALASYITAQMILMVVNVLRTIGGIEYAEIGSSDLAQWVALPTVSDFYRAQALLTLAHYRRAAGNNSWRFDHLRFALKCLRNIVGALSFLMLLLVAFSFFADHRKDPLFLIFSALQPDRSFSAL